jgi:hypothetical protein
MNQYDSESRKSTKVAGIGHLFRGLRRASNIAIRRTLPASPM